MTSLDLRILYRRETGLPPTYGKDNRDLCTYRGGLRQDYAKWLEEYRGANPIPMSMIWQRVYFKRDTGNEAMYKAKNQELYYTREYKEWLEELLCKALSILEPIKR